MSSQSVIKNPQQISQQLHEEYGHQLVKFMTQVSNLIDFHSSTSFLFANSKDKLEAHKQDAVKLVTTHANFVPIFSAIASVTDAKPSTWLAQEMAKATSVNSALLIDASSIVFAHSLLEAHLYFLCELCFRVFPKDWEKFIASKELKPMTVNELLSKDPAKLLAPIWKSEFVRLDRSLLAKAERLHELCKPAADSKIVRDFTYSEVAMKDFDKLRHDIIHDLSFLKKSAETAAKLTWVNQVGLYFFMLVRHKYGFEAQINAAKLPTLFAVKNS